MRRVGSVLSADRGGQRSRRFTRPGVARGSNTRNGRFVSGLNDSRRKVQDRTGWSRTILKPNQETARYRCQPKAELTKPVKEPKATWVEAKFFADVEYRDITSEELLRQSSFKGLSRNDKA